MTSLHAYFHAYCDGPWETPISETIDAIEWSGLADEIPALHVGLVGSVANCATVLACMREVSPVPVYRCAESRDGFEQVTLHRLAAHAAVEDGYFLYLHTKGVWAATQPMTDDQRPDREPFNHAWRRSMTYDTITRWRECVLALDEGADTVGAHSIPPEYGGPYWAGNFWWATGHHIRLLPPLLDDHRYRAEAWVGTRPGAYMHEIRTGWPGPGTLWEGAWQ